MSYDLWPYQGAAATAGVLALTDGRPKDHPLICHPARRRQVDRAIRLRQQELFRQHRDPPLTRAQRVDIAKRLIEIHRIAYGANHQEDILPVILEGDREYLRQCLGGNR